jgi:AAA15 family ATPase/GTPase
MKDFPIAFDGEDFVDIFVGKNGPGKSNFLEAMVDAFRLPEVLR